MKRMIYAENQKILFVNNTDRDFLDDMSQYFLKIQSIKDEKIKKELREDDYDLIFVDLRKVEVQDLEIVELIRKEKPQQKIIVSINTVPDETLFLDLLNLNVNVYLSKKMPKEKQLERIGMICETIENEKISIIKQKEVMFQDFGVNIIENSFFDKLINEKRKRNLFFSYLKENQEENQDFIKRIKDIVVYDNNLHNVEVNSLNGYNKQVLQEFAYNLKKLKEIFKLSKDLTPMGEALENFEETINKVLEENIDLEEKPTKLCHLLRKDISNFIVNIFIEGDVDAFNYLSDSLKSSIQQLRLMVFKEELEDEGEDEFF